jgi:hypothetical protein
MIAFAAILFFAAAAGFLLAGRAPARARATLRFACALYGVLAMGLVLAIAPVTPIVTSLGAMLLALSLFGTVRHAPAVAALLAGAACVAGLLAAMRAEMALAVIPQVLCAVVSLVLARRPLFAGRPAGIYLALGALCLLAAASSLLTEDTRVALPLFCAAGLLGFALALSRGSEILVDKQGRAERTGAIGRVR